MIGGIDPNDGAALTDSVTAINTALTTLQRLGRSDQADTLIADVDPSSAYAVIAADLDHSEDWKLTAYARRYATVMADLARRLTSAAATGSTQDQDDAARVYGIKGLPGDVASLAISRRDAGDRVAAIDLVARPDQLGDLLVDAIRMATTYWRMHSLSRPSNLATTPQPMRSPRRIPTE